MSYEQDSTRFDVSYLAHSTTVTNLSWRKVWHQEQNVDNLLYTHCADNRVRVWSYSDPHSCNMLQNIVTIDTNTLIQPRRLSMGSMSKSRFSFILGSRDLARAAESALQAYRNTTDHALEHLIEVANRSPEICIILDGLGHMSAWGIENAGLKNKLPSEKFNVALVDGVGIQLPSQSEIQDFAQVSAFANNDVSASLCILVHSYSGQIDWYQGSFVEFFDTSDRIQRTRIKSCWSGHDSPIDCMISSHDHRSFLSLTDRGQMIAWSQSPTGALMRAAEAEVDSAVIDVVFLYGNEYAVLLHPDALSLWDLRTRNAKVVTRNKLRLKNPVSVCEIANEKTRYLSHLAVLYRSRAIEFHSMRYLRQDASRQSNGIHKASSQVKTITLPKSVSEDQICFCSRSSRLAQNDEGCVYTCSEYGSLVVYGLDFQNQDGSLKQRSSMATGLVISGTMSVLDDRFCAIVNEDYRTLSIWNLKQGLYDFVHSFQEFDDVQEVYWYSTQNNLSLLAVQFTYSIAILGQQKYMGCDKSPAWALQQVIHTRTHSSHVIGALCWVDKCHVAVGLGNQILTFEVGQEKGNSQYQSKDNVNAQTLMHLQVQNASLPVFAPEILALLFQAGDRPTSWAILSSLREELRFLTQDEAVYIDNELTSSIVLSRGHLSDGNTTISSASTSQDGTIEHDELKSNLEQAIGKICQLQLSAIRQQRLRDVIDVGIQLEQNRKAMDSLALVYLYHFLDNIKQVQSVDDDLKPVPYSAIVHASMSQTQESLLHFIMTYIEERGLKMTWSTARSLGLFLFISEEETMKLYFESVARAEYNRNADDKSPVDCSLYYLALNKKAILQSLWRRTVGIKEKESTMKLLARDFTDPKWKATALKNAYALLSKRRFEYAAAFFLLGGSLADAVNVCINQIQDLQLAIAITRVWSGDVADRQKIMKNLTEKAIPEIAIDTHEARWMAAWACIHAQDEARAVQSMVKPIDLLFEDQMRAKQNAKAEAQRQKNLPFRAMHFKSNEPTLLLNLYRHLREALIKKNSWTREVITPTQEWDFVMRCVDWYCRAGLDWLALRLVATWDFVDWQIPSQPSISAPTAIVADLETPGLKSALDEWLAPEISNVKSKDTNNRKIEEAEKPKPKPPPTQFVEPSADSLLDSFGF